MIVSEYRLSLCCSDHMEAFELDAILCWDIFQYSRGLLGCLKLLHMKNVFQCKSVLNFNSQHLVLVVYHPENC